MSSRIEEQDFTAEKVDLTIWKRLYAFALLNRPLLMLILASLVIVSLVDVAYPLLSRYAIDHFVTPRITDGIVPFAAVYAALVILQAAGTFLFISRSGKMEMEIAYAIRQQAFEKLQNLSFSFYDKTAVGYLMARMIADVGRLSEMVAWSIVDVLYALFYVVSSIITIFLLNWKLALVVVAVIPPLAVISLILQKKILRYQRDARKQNSRITGAFNEGIMGAMTTKTLVREDANAAEFDDLTEGMRRVSIRAALLKLPEPRIGADGRLLEWHEELEEREIQHRHVSHLYGLYPAGSITPEDTPELAEACRQSLLTRGYAGTGWSLAWKICLWARLYDGESCYRLIRQQLTPVSGTDTNYSGGGGSYPNLLDAHPPFQIDGNFGYTAGVNEMLVQSHRGCPKLLPALPKAWKDGHAYGIRLRGGKTVNMAWKDGQITFCEIK